MAAFQESQFRCNLEFLRSSKPGIGRVIRFNHGPDAVPPQLQGRLSLEAWQVHAVTFFVLPLPAPPLQIWIN
jgi:hypothetical protein